MRIKTFRDTGGHDFAAAVLSSGSELGALATRRGSRAQVARGDLGVELGLHRVPAAQKSAAAALAPFGCTRCLLWAMDGAGGSISNGSQGTFRNARFFMMLLFPS